MTRRGIVWVLLLGLAMPAYGLDEKKDEGAKKGTTAAEKVDAKGKEKKKESPILRLAELRLDQHLVPARMINLPLPGKTKTLQDVLDRMEKWSEDEKIGAVLLDLSLVRLSMPDVEELRAGIGRMQEAGKKVMAFLNGGTPQAYLLAAAADEIAMAPTGAIMLPGVGRVFPFMKGHYQMLGLEFDVITAGRFKYPGFITSREPSKYFEEEFNTILDSWIGDYMLMIGRGRNLSPDAVKKIVDTALFDASSAQQHGLVDTLAYLDEYRSRILRREKMKRMRGQDDGLANVNSIQDFFEIVNEAMQKAQEARKAVGPKIAVLHARGPIVDISLGAGFASSIICRDDFVKVLDELRKNKSIKAVVMRVDSPGGSGYASDVIWKKLRELDEEKPLVVSMGTVAGSGGYYIACPARRIFALPTTITGSIGVLGIFRCAQSAFNRMDYELLEMKRGQRSLLGSPHRELEKKDRDFIQDYINDFYTVFIDRVATTRKIPASEVRKIAEGRIYTGRQALEVGLVDELGGIAEAIEAARRMANIPPSAELKIVHYPRAASFGEIFESFSSVGLGQVMQMFSQGVTAAPTVTFDQQLLIMSQRIQPLCWMAVPDFYGPQALWRNPLAGPVGVAQPQFSIEALLKGGGW
ncbi:MAG: signal peptide peptidase SppA [Planctomycetes bacterium]|nr:signal peptide peptidase SppA [Planctomycetota bacterium]